MPTYEYICATCGVFEARAPVSQFAAPQACPACGQASARDLLSAPQLSKVTPLARKSHMINERASDSPRRAKANGLKPKGPRIASRAAQGSGGAKSLTSSRPWMISR